MRTTRSASKCPATVKVEAAATPGRSLRHKRRGSDALVDPEPWPPSPGDELPLSKLAKVVRGPVSSADEVHVKENASEVNEGDHANDFELERLRLIQQNRERMMQLKLPDMAAPVARGAAERTAKPTRRGIGSRKSKQTHVEPVRRSGRQRGEQADALLSQGVDYETRGGQVVLNSGSHYGADSQAAAVPRLRVSEIEEIPFLSEFGTEDTDAAFLAQLKALCDSASQHSSKSGPKPSLHHKYSLQEKHARKLTQKSVTMVEFAPLAGGQLLVAAADKDGNVGLWDVNKSADGEEEDSASVMFKPHQQFVSGMAWKPDGASLFTLAYDGCLRLMDVERGVFQRVHHSAEDEYSALACSSGQGPEVAYLADNTGNVCVVDLNAGSTCQELELHDRKINSLSLDPTGRPLLVTASTDNTVAVWDLRKTGKKAKPLTSLPHNRSSHGAYWDPSGRGRIATISFDDTVRVYGETSKGGFNLDQTIRHNNNTGRWILPFKPRWSPGGDTIAVGAMGRGIDFIDPGTGSVAQVVRGEFLTAISSRNAFHPWRSVMAATTSSGRVHIFQ